ncbi:MAG: sporulation integral membrane protein YtvI [Brotaphodocola sp.]
MKKYAKVILNIVIPLVQIALVCFLLPKLLVFFMPFVIGWIIAMIANPLVRWLEKRLKIVRKHSSMAIVILVLAGILGLTYLLIARLVHEAVSFAQDLPQRYMTAVTEMESVFDRFDSLFRIVPKDVQQAAQEVAGNVGQMLSSLAQNFAAPTVEAAGSLAKAIPGVLVYTAVTILSSYFFIAEQDKIWEFWHRHLPENMNRYLLYLRRDVKRLIGGYFSAQFKIMFVVAGILLIGFLVLGMEHSVLLAVIIAVLDFLPMLGTGTVLIPWSVLKLLTGNYAIAAGMILLYILTQVVRQMIQPKIVGDSMGLPPLATLFFLYLGFKVHGLSGMIIAVPVGMIALNLYQYGAFDGLIQNVKILLEDVQKLRREK